MPTTFNGTAIGNHDLKIVDDTYITIDFLGNVTVNKIMGASTDNKDYEFPMLNGQLARGFGEQRS
jgi:hypothetical protein